MSLAFFSRWRGRRESSAPADPAPSGESFALDLAQMYSPVGTVNTDGLGVLSGMTREMALQLPIIIAVRQQLLAVIGALPLRERDIEGRLLPRVNQKRWMYPCGQRMTRLALIKRTVDDLFFDGESLWTVERRLVRNSVPTEFKHWPIGQWRFDKEAQQWVCTESGNEYRYAVTDGVYFEGLTEGVLHTGGAAAILDGLRIRRGVSQSVDTPVPLGIFTPKSGQLAPHQLTQIMQSWESSRRAGRTAVLPNDIEFTPVQISPRDRQLLDALNATALDLVRATSGDPEDVGISTTSRTYGNVQDARTDFLRYHAVRFLGPIADRLSMPDITPGTVEFDLTAFTRGSDADRFAAYQVGLDVGVFADENEVREAEGLPPLSPKQLADRKAKAQPAQAQQDPNQDPQPQQAGAPANGKESPPK